MHEQEITRTKQEMVEAAEVLERAERRRAEREDFAREAAELRNRQPRGRSGITRPQR